MMRGVWLCLPVVVTACAAAPPRMEVPYRPTPIDARLAAVPLSELQRPPPPPPDGIDDAEPSSVSTSPILLAEVLTVRGVVVPHRLPSEQQIDTPVPIYIQPPPELGVTEATLYYKPFGATRYKKMPMKSFGAGFAQVIPCGEVTTTGPIEYFITLDDGSERPLDFLGTQKEPLVVEIMNELRGDPPSLPGKKPPRQCPGYICDHPDFGVKHREQ